MVNQSLVAPVNCEQDADVQIRVVKEPEVQKMLIESGVKVMVVAVVKERTTLNKGKDVLIIHDNEK